MTHLILTTDSSAAGVLRQAGLGDVVIAIERRLVWGPLPSESERDAFFGVGRKPNHGPHWLDGTPAHRLEVVGAEDAGLIELCADCDAIELWCDPTPNGQLLLLWLLDFWRAKGAAAPKLGLRHAGVRVGDLQPEQLATMNVSAVWVTHDHLDAARSAWRAYCAPSPQSWPTGLGATEARMLELIASGGVRPFDVFPGREKPNQRRVFDYWEVGALLDGLARCPVPAIAGLDEGPFSLEMHDDPRRHERYTKSRLSLTDFGHSVLAGRDDFRRHNPIYRWWGGTELTNERLWRWDSETRSLVVPG
jgi:hypothetical protein